MTTQTTLASALPAWRRAADALPRVSARSFAALHYGGRFRQCYMGSRSRPLPPLPQTNSYVYASRLSGEPHPFAGVGNLPRDVVAIIANPNGAKRWTGREWIHAYEGHVVSNCALPPRSIPSLESRVLELERFVLELRGALR